MSEPKAAGAAEIDVPALLGAFDWDMLGDTVTLDPVAREILGLGGGSAPVRGEDILARIHPADRLRIEHDVDRARLGSAAFANEYAVLRRDGGEHVVSLLLRGTDDGRRASGFFHDVTEIRRRAAEPGNDYRELFAALDTGFCIIEVDPGDAGDAGAKVDYRIVEANPAFYRETGFSEAIIGQWLRTAAPALEEHWYELYGAVARTGKPARFEQHSDVLGRWFGVFAFRIGDFTPPRVAILFSDISARREAEGKLERLNEELEARVAERTAERDQIWKQSRDLLGVAEADGTWIAVNPAWTRALGWEAAEVVGRTSHWLEHPDDHEKTRSEIARLAAGNETLAFENRFLTKDGSYRVLAWTAVPVEGRLYTVARDITEEKDRADELAAAQEALRQAQKMEAVGQLTGGLAHDFNNILAGISGSLELMEARIAQGRLAESSRYLIAAKGAASRAAALTHRLLAFSRRQTLEPKIVNINRLTAGMEDLLRQTVGPSIEVEMVAAGGLWSVLVDANQLENALLNLCINARDAMPQGGRIVIETSNRWLDDRAARERDLPAGQYVSLCVSDNGTGMTQDVIDRAFDPFFTTKPIGQGTGLGLSMIYGFVRQSGGQVRIYSEAGQGTMVCLYLPRHRAGDEQDAAPPVEDVVPTGEGETILVVDDEPLVRMIVVDVLNELGFRTLEAGDGLEAIEILRSATPLALLITDVGLPKGMNGRQVAESARQFRPDIPVLFMTGYAENAVLSHGHLEHGMQVVTKPFDMNRLKARVQEMITAAAR